MFKRTTVTEIQCDGCGCALEERGQYREWRTFEFNEVFTALPKSEAQLCNGCQLKVLKALGLIVENDLETDRAASIVSPFRSEKSE